MIDSTAEARREAGRRLLVLLREGLPLGGRSYGNCEELYDRIDRLIARRDDGRDIEGVKIVNPFTVSQ